MCIQGDYGGQPQQKQGDGDGDEGGKTPLEAVRLLLGVAGSDAGMLAQEGFVAHAGENKDGNRDGEEQEKDHSRPHFVGEKLAHKQKESDTQQNQGHACRHGGGKAVHVLVPERSVLTEAAGHVPTQKGVHVAGEQAAQAQDGVHLRIGGVGFPFAHRLAGDFHLFRKVLLGHAPALAEELQVFTECH